LFQWGSNGSGNGQFIGPNAVATDAYGNVYVSDLGNNRVEKFDSNGNYLTQWGSSGSGNGQFDLPYGIAVDGSGNVYVLDQGNNRIQVFDSNGNYLAQWGSYGSGNGQFNAPYGIAMDGSGNLYVSDIGNSRIEKFALPYTISGTISSGGTGILGVTVTLTLGGVTIGTITTDSNGNYSFTALSNGSYTVTASKSGYTFFAPDNITINGANSTGDNIVAYASGGGGGTPVGYSPAWLIITLISLTIAGGCLMRKRIGRT